MEYLSYIKEIFEPLSYLASFLGFFGIIIVLFSYFKQEKWNIFNGKKINFEVVFNCTKRFQEIMQDIAKIRDKEKTDKIKSYELKSLLISYLELCDEELFHINNNIIPDKVAKSWLYAMFDYLPASNGSCDKKERCIYDILIDDQMKDVMDIFNNKKYLIKYLEFSENSNDKKKFKRSKIHKLIKEMNLKT